LKATDTSGSEVLCSPYLLPIASFVSIELSGTSMRRTFLVAALAIALLVAPVAYHRWVFRLHGKSPLLKAANLLALLGLGVTALVIAGSVLLVVTFVESGWLVPILTACLVASLGVLWFVVPVRERLMVRHEAGSERM
jgi:hypothetical protein